MSKSDSKRPSTDDATRARLTGTAGLSGPDDDKKDQGGTGGIPIRIIREARGDGKKS